MGKRVFYLLQGWCLLGLFVSAQAQARIQDSTLDFADPSDQSIAKGAFYMTGPDPWPAFLAQLRGYKSVSWGIALQGANPFHQNESAPLAPASVQKLVTMASALRYLGPDARFNNTFEGNFDRQTGTLTDPKFTVSGDPTWGHEQYEGMKGRLNKLSLALKKMGVQRVVGAITVISAHPELDLIPVPKGWPKRWTLQCMATLTSSFMFNGNCGSISLISLTHAAWTTPGVDLPITLNLTKGSTNNLTISATLNSTGRVTGYTISGKFAKPTNTFFEPLQNAYVTAVPVHLGAHWLQNLFALSLSENSIVHQKFKRGTFEALAAEPVTIDLSSLSLADILRVAVPNSINAILDRIFYETAIQMHSTQNAEPSYAILHEVLGPAHEDLLQDVKIFDGSGLDTDDRLRSDMLWTFLDQMKAQPYFKDFFSALAIAGMTGTLAGRLTDPLTKGRIFAKTGTIDGIYNLAGYFQTQSQTLEPFSILSESALAASQVRGMIDQIATEFALQNSP